jgi:hypothetical protein
MNGLGPLLFGVLVLLGLFLLFRALVLWYWKIDEVVTLLKRIEGHLASSGMREANPEIVPLKTPKNGSRCIKCAEEIDTSGSWRCRKCGTEVES